CAVETGCWEPRLPRPWKLVLQPCRLMTADVKSQRGRRRHERRARLVGTASAVRNADPPDEILKPRVAVQRIEFRIHVEPRQKCVVLPVGPLQPLERLILLAKRREHERYEKAAALG